MWMRTCLAAAVLAASTFTAQASTVEMVVDVMATNLQQSHLEQGGVVTTNDPSFVPAQFQWLIRFDLDQPTVYPVQSTNGTGGEQLTTSTFFQGGETSLTPYSATLIGLVPPGAPVLSPGTTQVYAESSTRDLSFFPMAGAQAVNIQTGFAGGGAWQAVADGLATTIAYGRSFNFAGAAAPVPNSQFQPMSSQDFVSYLQSKVGQTQVGAFNESITKWVQKTNPPGDVILISDAPDALVAQDGIWISGDVSIRSVAVVPEPATYLLMGLGLALVVVVLGRRQAA